MTKQVIRSAGKHLKVCSGISEQRLPRHSDNDYEWRVYYFATRLTWKHASSSSISLPYSAKLRNALSV